MGKIFAWNVLIAQLINIYIFFNQYEKKFIFVTFLLVLRENNFTKRSCLLNQWNTISDSDRNKTKVLCTEFLTSGLYLVSLPHSTQIQTTNHSSQDGWYWLGPQHKFILTEQQYCRILQIGKCCLEISDFHASGELTARGCQIGSQRSADFPQMGQILDFFRSHFSKF